MVNPIKLTTASGDVVLLTRDSPADIVKQLERDIKRWQWDRNVETAGATLQDVWTYPIERLFVGQQP